MQEAPSCVLYSLAKGDAGSILALARYLFPRQAPEEASLLPQPWEGGTERSSSWPGAKPSGEPAAI